MKELTKIEEVLLVAIWHLAENAYGVKIRQYVTKIAGRELSYGHLYSALNQLVTKKYVTKSLGKPSTRRLGRPRVYYSVSSLGMKALRAAKEMNERLWSEIPGYILDRKR
ncbi:MAG: helix-turn-helix transcriptional regulator [Candidatus Aminicenantes bacterium]|nr:helix-turn-helix transcriptional regulator [Candidatus Aminicenantes bacterium]